MNLQLHVESCLWKVIDFFRAKKNCPSVVTENFLNVYDLSPLPPQTLSASVVLSLIAEPTVTSLILTVEGQLLYFSNEGPSVDTENFSL